MNTIFFIEDFFLEDTKITFFLIINVLWFLANSALLYSRLRSSAYEWLRPSIFLTILVFALLEFPLALYSTFFEQLLYDPYPIAIIVHTNVTLVLLLSKYTFKRALEIAKRKLTFEITNQPTTHTRHIIILTFIFFALLGAYLFFVPFSDLGLVAIFNDSFAVDWKREESLKLLENPIPRYAHTIMLTAVAPFLISALIINITNALKNGKIIPGVVLSLLIPVVAIGSSLTGARGTFVNILLVMAGTFILRSRSGIKIHYLILSCAVALVPAALISLAREGINVDFESFSNFYQGILNRALFVPAQIGGLHMHYVQTNGFWGVHGISKLAILLGEEPLNPANIVGQEYIGNALSSVTASTSFIYIYYCCFGYISILMTVIASLLIDVAIWVFNKVTPGVLIPLVLTLFMTAMGFVQSDYTTVWYSQGYGPTLLIGLLLWKIDEFVRRRQVHS